MTDRTLPEVPGAGPTQIVRRGGHVFAGRSGCIWVLDPEGWMLADDQSIVLPPSTEFRYHDG